MEKEKGKKDHPSRAKQLAKEAREKIVSYLLAAFGLVAGLAWNDAVKALIERAWPMGEESLIAKFFYALSMTLVVVIVTLVLVRYAKSKKED